MAPTKNKRIITTPEREVPILRATGRDRVAAPAAKTDPAVGSIIRSRRRSLGLVVDWVAYVAKIHPEYLMRIESGQTPPSPEVAARIADAIMLPVESLVSRRARWAEPTKSDQIAARFAERRRKQGRKQGRNLTPDPKPALDPKPPTDPAATPPPTTAIADLLQSVGGVDLSGLSELIRIATEAYDAIWAMSRNI